MPLLIPFKFLVEKIHEADIRDQGYEPVYHYPDDRLPFIRDGPYPVRKGVSKPLQRLGAPLRSSPTSTIPSKRRQGRASAEHGKHGGPRKSSKRGGRARRKECPKGHYWSYKEKKCMKSKY